MDNIEKDIPCEIYGNGEKRRDFTHVDDIVRGLVKILERGTYYDDFEFGKGKNHSVNEVAEMFDITPVYKKDKPGEAQITLCDSSTAKKILDWKPMVNLEDYIYEQKKSWKNTYTEEN